MINSPEAQLVALIVSEHDFAQVQMNPTTNQKSLHVSKLFKSGDVISDFGAGTVQSFPTYLTVQVGEDKHITLVPEFLQYINHSCDPTAFFNTTTMKLECLKDLEEGDEITFFYPSTEWEMAQPFTCHCGSPECLHTINGASKIPADILDKYKLTDFIQSKRKE
jgi:hypothetical protein